MLAPRTDFESDIFNNPINQLKAIKEHLLNFQETYYKMLIITNALKSQLITKEKENEDVPDYIRCFRTSKEISEFYVGGP